MKIETKFEKEERFWVIVDTIKCKAIQLGTIIAIDVRYYNEILAIDYHFHTDVGGAFRHEREFLDSFFPHTPEGKQEAEARVKELNKGKEG